MDILSLNKQMQSGGSGVKIHVVDTGCISLSYVTIAPFRGEPTPDGVWHTGNSIDYTPTREHGTMMCSIAHTGAPDAEIISYNAIPDKTISYLNEALAYIVERVKADTTHRHIITMSLTCSADADDSTMITLHELIKQLDALGALVVVAAGNDGHENLGLYPSAFEEPVTVSAVEADGTFAGFSTHHGEVDFCELGRKVPCTDMSKQSTTCDGTSPATQILGAKLAVMWSKNLALTADEIYEQAQANVIDLGESGRDPYYGWGWIKSVEIPVVRDSGNGETGGKTMDTLRLTTPYTRGDSVTLCQQRLIVHGFSVTADGIFGKQTEAAVKAFQAAKSLTADGIVGSKTWAALNAEPAETSTTIDVDKMEPLMRRMVGDPYAFGADGRPLTEDYLLRLKNAHPVYFNGGRYEWMLEQIKLANSLGREIYAEDCSGLIMAANKVLHFFPESDLTADGIYKRCTKITRAEAGPGCFSFVVDDGTAHHVGWIGNDGLYEAVGGVYGVVFRSDIDDRATLNLMTGKTDVRPAWNAWGKLD